MFPWFTVTDLWDWKYEITIDASKANTWREWNTITWLDKRKGLTILTRWTYYEHEWLVPNNPNFPTFFQKIEVRVVEESTN